MEQQFIIENEQAMLALGQQLAKCIPPATVIFLYGQLGAGKTTLTRGFLSALGYKGRVKSPTYTLVESYHFPDREVHHFDLYRLKDEEELYYLGFEEYFNDQSIVLIEWPEILQHPHPDLKCYIETIVESNYAAPAMALPSAVTARKIKLVSEGKIAQEMEHLQAR